MSEKIYSLLDEIELNQLVVPEFQREFIWTLSQSQELLRSLFNSFPTGSLLFWKTTEPYEYIDPFKKSRLYKAFVLCGEPGKMEGIFSDNNKTVSLTGDCKIVPLRHPSIFGHNSVKIDFLLPPKSIGFKTEINTHYFKKRINIKLCFAPKPIFKFNIKKMDNEIK